MAGFGVVATSLERLLWRPRRAFGVAHVVSLVAAVGAGAVLATRRRPFLDAPLIWVTLGGRSLERAALRLADALDAGDLERARTLAPALVGRDPSELNASELARAAVESVAENTNDAVVAPLVWAAAYGAPGAAAYRAVNTLDAMIGHKDDCYREFGWFAARLDDYASWTPARVTVALVAACAPLVGGSSRAALRTAWRDGRQHPSPNAGRVEAAFAGALGLRLGGLNRYTHGLERRPDLGEGRAPDSGDIGRAVVLARLVGAAAVVVALGVAGR